MEIEKPLSIYNLAIICRAILILDKYLFELEKIYETTIQEKLEKKNIVDFVFALCLNDKIEGIKLEISKIIQNLVLNNLVVEADSDDSKFYYHNSENFKKFMIKEGGKIDFINGTLTNTIKDGYIFIADEMNVSSPSNNEINDHSN